MAEGDLIGLFGLNTDNIIVLKKYQGVVEQQTLVVVELDFWDNYLVRIQCSTTDILCGILFN